MDDSGGDWSVVVNKSKSKKNSTPNKKLQQSQPKTDRSNNAKSIVPFIHNNNINEKIKKTTELTQTFPTADGVGHNVWAMKNSSHLKLLCGVSPAQNDQSTANVDDQLISLCVDFQNDRGGETLMESMRWSPIGLVNSGNACYRNCILQCLFSLPIFRKLTSFLMSHIGDDIRNLSRKFVVWRELLDFSQSVYSCRSATILPDMYFHHCFEEFHNYADRNNSRLGNSQHDCMEFFTFFMDNLHEPIKADSRNINGVVVPHEEEGWNTVGKGGSKLVVDEQSKTAAEDIATSSVVTKIFQGLLRCEVDYKQKKLRSTTFQTFHCLTLNFSEGFQRRQRLSEALNDYFTSEPLENQKIRKQVKLQHLPQVLVIHISRFSFNYKANVALKINRHMEYFHDLSLSPRYFSDLARSEISNSYELQAIALHHGQNATEGHYTAYMRDESGVWWHGNDTNITSLSADEVLLATAQVYLLFYRLVGS